MSDPFQSYHETGFAVTKPLFDSEELSSAREAVKRLEQRVLSGADADLTAVCVLEADLPAKKRGGVELREAENAAFIIGDPTRFEPLLLKLLLKNELIEVVQRLLGTEDIVYHFANITSKSPKIGSGIAWHRDFPNKYISPAEPKMLRTMICLDGMSASNGATTFLPASHKCSEKKAQNLGKGGVTTTCEPGSVVAIHPLVLHGGAPNGSPIPRRNIVIQWGEKGVPLLTAARESLTELTVEGARALATREP